MEPIQAVVLERIKSIACAHFSSTELLQLPVIVAYSGGLDSSVLLHACQQLQQQNQISELAAVHVNHGIQELNDAWEKHCKERCEDYQIHLYGKRFTLFDGAPVSENKAREARYQYFEQLLETPALLLFAHHLDDQVETMLFRMIRGTGVHGLAGIPHSRQLANGRIVRPFLECSRSELEDYAKCHKLSWVDDPSNQHDHYSRNYLRNNIIPTIQSKWPEFSRAFKQLSELASEQTLLMDDVAVQDFLSVQQADSALSIEKFNFLSKVRQKNLLHYWVRQQTKSSPTAIEIGEVISQLRGGNSEVNGGGAKAIKVKLGRGWLRTFDKHIYYCLHNEPTVLTAVSHWENVEQPLILSNGISLEFISQSESNTEPVLCIRKPEPGETITVQARRGGEKARPLYREHRADLKKIFQELKVPPWKREWLPIVYFNEKIACIPGVFVDQSFKSDDNQFQIKIRIGKR